MTGAWLARHCVYELPLNTSSSILLHEKGLEISSRTFVDLFKVHFRSQSHAEKIHIFLSFHCHQITCHQITRSYEINFTFLSFWYGIYVEELMIFFPRVGSRGCFCISEGRELTFLAAAD